MAYFETKTLSVLGHDMELYQVSQLMEQAVQMASQAAHLCPSVIPQPQKGAKRNKNQAKWNENFSGIQGIF